MINAVFGVVIAAAFERFTGHVDIVNVGLGRNFSGQYNQAGVAKRFCRNSAVGILCQNGIENSIGDLIGNLVGMPFRDGL